MPPFTTLNGQTGYFDNNGQFVPATQEQYNQQFGMLQQFGGNPFLNAAQQSPTYNQRTNFVQQGTIQSPETASMTNEQKVMQAQGDDVPMLGNMPYVQKGNEFGVQKGKSFFPYNAETASGHPLNTKTNTVFNAYDLMTNRKNDIVNPYSPQAALMHSQKVANLLNNLSNNTTAPTIPTQTQVTSPIATTPEIMPTQTAEQAGGGNWLTNMFNKPSVEGVPTAENVVDNGLKSDVLGDWGKMGFDTKKAFTGTAGTSLLGAGIGAATKLIGANASTYDQRVGMSKPNAFGTMFGDSTFTQIGSSFGPAGMAIGGTVDLIKNAIKYVKQKDRYENKKLATDTMQSIDDARENMKPDYTGYARNGTQVNPYLKAQNGIKTPTNPASYFSWDGASLPNNVQNVNIQSTVPTGISRTQPSLAPIEDVLYNTEDDLLNEYRGKSLGAMPFPYNNTAGIGMGYNDFGNNAWMSTGLGSVEDPTTILGHLVDYYKSYEENKNDIPSLYLFEKDLNKEKSHLEDVMVSADKYYNSRNELLDMADNLEREGRFINNELLPKGITYNVVADDPGNKLIRSFTPDKDKFMGSVTLTPEMYQQIASSKTQEEAKRKLVKMAKLPNDINMDNLFIHMNLSRPRNLSAYLKAKNINPESVKGWHNERPGNKYDKNGNLIKPTVKTYKQGGVVNPYLKAQYGTNVTIDKKKINTGSKEYRDMYTSGNLMNVDEEGMPIRWSGEEAVVTAQMTDEERQKRNDLYNAAFPKMTTEDGFDDQGNYIYYDNPSGKGSLDSDLVFGAAELTGIPSLYRVAKDPVGHLQSALKTMDGIATLGTMPYDAYNTPEDLSKSLDAVGAVSTVMPFAKPVASGINQAAKTFKPSYMSLYAPMGKMYGQNQVLTQQSRLLNPKIKEKYFKHQAPPSGPKRDIFEKMPSDYNNRITRENYENFVNNIHGSTDYSLAKNFDKQPGKLGTGNYGKPGAVFSDAPLNNLEKDIINAHEKNHGIFAGTLSKEMKSDLTKPFGTNRPIPNYPDKHQADEVLSRMAQFKNAIGMGNNQVFTLGHLNYIRNNYTKLFTDNSITDMLSKIKPGSIGEKQFLKNMNKYAFGIGVPVTVATGIGMSSLENK